MRTAKALGDLIEHLEHRGITVLLASVPAQHLPLIERVGVVNRLRHENHLLPTLADALGHARRHAHIRPVPSAA